LRPTRPKPSVTAADSANLCQRQGVRRIHSSRMLLSLQRNIAPADGVNGANTQVCLAPFCALR
jgi:hypothetical protein